MDTYDQIEMLSNQANLELPVGVITGVEGGYHGLERQHSQGFGPLDYEAGGRDGDKASGIMTNVSIAQTYIRE